MDGWLVYDKDTKKENYFVILYAFASSWLGRVKLELFYFLRGRATSSPPQFGQIESISFAHLEQNVHS